MTKLTTVCVRRFTIGAGRDQRTYTPGEVIEDTRRASWAIENGFAENRGGSPANKAKRAPKNKS
ncbi:MAG: hypothetical protein AAF801_12830 [Pseudomonadota bacterium]